MTAERLYPDETIAAIATGSARAGIGIVRVSGTLTAQIARAITGRDLSARHAHYLPFLDASDQMLDQGIAIIYEAPHSFTGESVLELHCHGGAVVQDMVLSRVIELGARSARPGEFSERAFYNDKLDLVQAEAINDLIESSSVAAARAAVRSLSGAFSSHVKQIKDELIGIRVWLESALDFSEEDIDFLTDSDLQQRSKKLVDEFDAVLAKAEQGQRLRDGLSIVIAGATNAGKSSLLNRLSGQETAIVTDIAGTTRDVLRTDITLKGLPLHIVDTAGIRETDDVVERLGIERAINAIGEADHVVVLIDATEPRMPDGLSDRTTATTVVINKRDLVSAAKRRSLEQQFKAQLSISADTGEGIQDLCEYLLSLAGHDSTLEGAYSARRRHITALREARTSTQTALRRLQENNFPELAAEELRYAQRSLDEITGRFDSEDLLGQIFSSFCIGK